MVGKKKKKVKEHTQLDDVPQYLKDFIDFVALKERPDEAEDMRKRFANKRKKAAKEEGLSMKKLTSGNYQFTDLEIVSLWSSFRVDFPEGQITRPQMMEVVRKIFPKCDAAIVINNIFQVFDSGNSGKIIPRDLLVAFTMAMKGTVEEKLHWTFKLYDCDGSGEIDPIEMEQIFTKLCTIAENTEKDQSRKSRREAQRARIEEKKLREKQEALEIKRLQLKQENEKNKVKVFSQNYKRVVKETNVFKTPARSVKKKISKSTENEKVECGDIKEKVLNVSSIAEELSNPSRDYRKFDPNKRAHELFAALDFDNNGYISENEFIKGCTSDETFVKLLTEFSGDFIWGYVDD